MGHDAAPNPFIESSPSAAAQSAKPFSTKQLLKPPMFALPVLPPQPKQKTAKMASKLAPQFQVPSDSNKPVSIMRPPLMPVASTSKSAVSLKPLVPPPVPARRPASPQKHLKTILTTDVAQATDPTKEGGGAEILSLFLQQHGHSFTSHTDRELQRGVMVSPDKRSRGKEPKLVRGGLAERAQHHMACSRTDLSLWRRQMEQKIDSSARLSSDVTLRVVKILHIMCAPDRPRAPPLPRAGLALCKLRGRHKILNDLPDGNYIVLFPFVSGSSSHSMNTAANFEEGRDILVWMPWHKAVLTNALEYLDVLNPPRSLLFCFRYTIVTTKLGSSK
ncbi:hypothetical protein BJ138DRAFT_1149791 [Hygrophoropsis aurantiaca]|uniref:Uncharacterized protein n=1 Tax=Hygrophoropsis aurantiaca TaxID=72124 RepID=A0ACB8AGX8_9AGAM|nr:hypothetical protein BJ138DRAFT_1149791 [Hygrophoropsis aurantiaca]